MLTEKRTILVIALAMSLGCGSSEPEPAEPAAPDWGAGTIVKNDPALDQIVPPDAKIEKLADGFQFTEGPVWVASGPHLLFSDIPANAIYKWAPGGTVSDFLKPVYEGEFEEGRFMGSNGLTLDAEKRLVFCEHGNGQISRMALDGDKKRTVLVSKYEGKRLNSPNDLVYKSDGWLYFTDPPYGFAKQDEDPAKELDFNGIFRLSPDAKKIEVLNKEQTRPNGIGFSPDEKFLYVANSDPEEKAWVRYPVNEDGTLGAGTVFHDVTSETAQGLPDGLKLDKQGNLYATGPGGVWIFTPEGTHLGSIQPQEVPANVAWGDDGKTLYMTARTGLYRIKLSVEGVRP
jgi:gluconolactonase